MTRKIPAYRLGHTIPEWLGDSLPGIDREFAQGARRVDINSLPSGDDIAMNLHYRLFLRHGYERRNGRPIDTSLPVEHFTAKELCTEFWTTKSHQSVGTIHGRVEHILAHHPGKGAEIEVKAHHQQPTFQHLWDHTGGHPHLFIVKSLADRPGTPIADLHPPSNVGYPTLISCHHKNMHLPWESQHWINYWRANKPVFVKVGGHA